MIQNNTSVGIPARVVQHYSDYITDREFLALLHLAAVEGTGKQAVIAASANMGYQNESSFMSLLKSMADKGAIVLTKYTVDVAPLWANCEGERLPVAPLEAKKKDNTHYILASQLFEYSKAETKHGLAAILKGLLREFSPDSIRIAYPLVPTIRPYLVVLTKEADLCRAILNLLEHLTPDEVCQYARYTYNQTTAKKGTWVPTVYNLVNWLPTWIERGKPSGDSSGVASIAELLG